MLEVSSMDTHASIATATTCVRGSMLVYSRSYHRSYRSRATEDRPESVVRHHPVIPKVISGSNLKMSSSTRYKMDSPTLEHTPTLESTPPLLQEVYELILCVADLDNERNEDR